jgi:hypothetical protein
MAAFRKSSCGAGGRGRRRGAGGRNNPNNVCTYQYMNKKKTKKIFFWFLNKNEV